MKNIILIITDTFRCDNLGSRSDLSPGRGATGPAGPDGPDGLVPIAIRTPELDRFAAEKAASIEGFYTGSFPTIPHRSDLATGTLGWPHYGWQSIRKSSPNHIASLLSDAGYATQLIADTPHLFTTRFHHGFEANFQHRGQESDQPLLHLNDRIERIVPEGKDRPLPKIRGATMLDLYRWINRNYRYESETFPAKMAETAIRWLEENHGAGPFLLWLDLFDPHEPWDPPEYLVKRYDVDYSGTPMLGPNYGSASDYSEAELRNLKAHYAAEVELVDRYIGRILQKVDDLRLLENSLLIITSDHGISIGEHDQAGKSNRNPNDDRYWPLYPELSHVPFLIAGPGIPGGVKLDLIAQPIDILPTVCGLAGVTIHPRQRLEGRSFAGQVRKGGGKHREFAVSGCYSVPSGDKLTAGGLGGTFKANTPFLIKDEWGFAPVGQRGQPELYRLGSDPSAQKNIANGNESQMEDLLYVLVEHLREHNAPPDTISMWSRSWR
jgi:arylsulfatase A-like enzyme